MDLGSWWIVDLIGPVILLIVLIWLILNLRTNRDVGHKDRSGQGARKSALREGKRRRTGTDEF